MGSVVASRGGLSGAGIGNFLCSVRLCVSVSSGCISRNGITDVQLLVTLPKCFTDGRGLSILHWQCPLCP